MLLELHARTESDPGAGSRFSQPGRVLAGGRCWVVDAAGKLQESRMPQTLWFILDPQKCSFPLFKACRWRNSLTAGQRLGSLVRLGPLAPLAPPDPAAETR